MVDTSIIVKLQKKYRTLKIEECEVGMKVLLTNPDIAYDICQNNPVIGSSWFCYGTVITVSLSTITVRWSNRYSNTYKDYELSLYDEFIDIDKNTHNKGTCVSIW